MFPSATACSQTLDLERRVCSLDEECSLDGSLSCIRGACEVAFGTSTTVAPTTTGTSASTEMSSFTETADGATAATEGDATLGSTGVDEGTSTAEASTETVVACPRLIEASPVIPTVVLLVDQSYSMWEPFRDTTRWAALQNALMDPESGIVPALQSSVRFGISFYTSFNGFEGGECPLLEEVAPSIMNSADIEALYSDLTPQHQTPTGESIAAITTTLLADPFPGPKIIVLATDGEPDTCDMPDPNLGQDESVAAARAAFEGGIQTFVISVGNDISLEHLQNLANAGAGIHDADDTGAGEGTGTGGGSGTSGETDTGTSTGALDDSGTSTGGSTETDESTGAGASTGSGFGTGSGGDTESGTESSSDAKYYVPEDRDALVAAFQEIIGQIRPCTYSLEDAVVPGRGEGVMTIGGETVPFNDPNGWRVNGPLEIELLGDTCESALVDAPEISVEFSCDALGAS